MQSIQTCRSGNIHLFFRNEVKLSVLGHSHFMPGVRLPWSPLKRRQFGTQTQLGRHAGSEDFFYPPETEPRFLGCLVGWLISSPTKLFSLPPKLKYFEECSCNSPTLNFMKILYKSIRYARLQSRFRFLTSKFLILSLELCFQTQRRILFMVLNAK